MSDVIIACDFSSKEETLKFLDQFKEEKPFVKIGMELFYAEGGEIVKEIAPRRDLILLVKLSKKSRKEDTKYSSI